MKEIPIDQLQDKNIIELQNRNQAKLVQALLTRVKEVNPDHDIVVYKYSVPCPLCGHETFCFSFDGKYFNDIQVNCKHCGIFFRPVVKRD